MSMFYITEMVYWDLQSLSIAIILKTQAYKNVGDPADFGNSA